MELVEIFQVLGIEQTKDERAIKNAYREKLAVTNPEDNPEGFKRLRTAYEAACNYANSPDEEEAQEEQDNSPAGLWAQKAAEIYGRMIERFLTISLNAYQNNQKYSTIPLHKEIFAFFERGIFYGEKNVLFLPAFLCLCHDRLVL